MNEGTSESTPAHSALSLEGSQLQGKTIRPHNSAQVGEAVEYAFDYRGNVTLELRSGEFVEGYVFNRTTENAVRKLSLFPLGSPEIRVVGYDEIVAIHFSGEDTACGKTWEAWVQKKQEQSSGSHHVA